MNDRVFKLREKSLKAKPYISMERAMLVDEVYKQKLGEVPIPILRALTFKNIMENKKIYIGEGELIVGERGEKPAATPTYPELCCHTLEDFEIMDKREKISFKVSEESKNFQQDTIIPFWKNKSMRHKIFQNVNDKWKNCYNAGIFTEFMEQRAPGHTVADDKIYNKGFKDLKKDIEEAINKLDFKNDEFALNKKNELEAMKICADAIITLGKRYSILAKEMANEEKNELRKKELLNISEVCDRVPENSPRTFQEALQMYWFVHIGVISELNTWDSFNPGRLDQHLYPFYKRETEEESLTREGAKELLECFWIKFNNQPAPPKVGITLAESGTYTDFANINSGGLKKDGTDGVNDVTYLVLDVIDEMRLLQPSSNIQVSKKNPDEFIKKACRIIRKGWGQPSVFNADEVISEMVNAGKSLEDARCGGTSGCVETGAFGKEAYILTGYLNLPKILEVTLMNGIDSQTGELIGLRTGEIVNFKSYDELFEAFKKQLHYFVEVKMKGNNIIEKLYMDNMPSPFLSIIISDCISKGKDYNSGGARYNTNYIQGVGIGTITDSLVAIKYQVFDKQNFSIQELMDALKNDFKGYEYIKNMVLNKTPKYGNDDDYADDIMKSVFDAYHDEVTGRKNMKGGHYRIDMLPTTCHVYFGSVMEASPDGRNAKKPLSEGISPSKGADKNGPTAVIKSASKMDHMNTGGTLLNQKFTPKVLEGEKGINNLTSLIRAYFRLDGHHIQFNVIDKSILLDAQKCPEDYNDLIVRVAGYSDYFNNLNKDLQDEIINRTEQSF